MDHSAIEISAIRVVSCDQVKVVANLEQTHKEVLTETTDVPLEIVALKVA